MRSVLILTAAIITACGTAPPAPEPNLTPAARQAAKAAPALVPLSPGAVTPAGWLRDWAEAAAHGITGDLDTRSETFRMAYKGQDFKARGVKPGGAGWPLEQAAYWLDGLVRLAYILDDEALIKKARSRLDPIVDGVLNGGDSFFYWLPKSELDDNFNNWAHSHIGRALVAYYEATRDRRILDALVKVYRNYPLPDMIPRFYPVNGAVNIDPMLDTFALSGDPQVLRNVLSYAGRPAVQRIAGQWMEGHYDEGHTVITYENMRVPALLYPWTGDRRMLQASEDAIEWGERRHGLVLGLISGEEFVAGRGSTRNVETCNVAAGAWTYNWLLRITGEAAYADRIERVFFNAGPAPVARDFQTMCYYQSPNRFSMELPKDRPTSPGGDSYRFTALGNDVLCCVGNLNRVIPNYIMHMWMATPDDGVAATLYGPAHLRATVSGGVPVEIVSDTNYPFEESIELTVSPDRTVDFPLYLRLPNWCQQPSVEVNGEAVSLATANRGFARINRTWESGDTVAIRFPMAVTIEHGRENDYPDLEYYHGTNARRLSRARGIENPFASVFYGPLLYSLPIPDAGANTVAEPVPFNYALDLDPVVLADGVDVRRQPMPEHWSWRREDAPVTLLVRARAFPWKPDELQPLPAQPVSGGEETTIELVPYGVTKFRVSMFPVTETMWNRLEP